ncbi:MAG: glycosyltransferase family protein [Bradyrhizobium sp.]|nr:glycosyltransferase family protein [Bradyrhizobium sp.]
MNSRESRIADPEFPTDRDHSGASLAAALCEAGHEHLQAGRPLEAQLCCRRALQADPDHVDALQLMGLLALQARQYDHAIEWIARADQRDLKTDHLCSLGIALEQQGLHEAAFKAFDRAVQLKPHDAELWSHCASALASLARPEQALASYDRVLQLNPRDADAAFRCGMLLITLKRPAEALACFELCDGLFPNHAAVIEQRGLALHDLKRYEEALAENLRAHALNPGSAEICNNVGAALQWLRRDQEALPWLDKALALKPHFVRAMINKASSLTQVRRIDEALEVYHHVQTIDPGNADAAWNAALLYLLMGDFEAGWAGREVRWRAHMRPAIYPHFSQPMWRGEEGIEGRTILILADEGIGDSIQFVRYAPLLAARGARVVLAVQGSLQPLLTAMPGVALCVPRSEPLPAFDLHCPMCNLPFAFATRLDTIPSAIPYLPAPDAMRVHSWEQRLQERLGAAGKLRVGLVWSGNPGHGNDHNRSVPLRALLPLLEADASFISLQKEPKADDRALIEQVGMIDLTAGLADFAETAALVSCLDLVISVDTSVAHLAGALGRPTWVLLPYTPDYRWLLDREDSPWYPTARLFRQTETRDWNELVGRVRTELALRTQLPS